jgi:hypothetical protein
MRVNHPFRQPRAAAVNVVAWACAHGTELGAAAWLRGDTVAPLTGRWRSMLAAHGAVRKCPTRGTVTEVQGSKGPRVAGGGWPCLVTGHLLAQVPIIPNHAHDLNLQRWQTIASARTNTQVATERRLERLMLDAWRATERSIPLGYFRSMKLVNGCENPHSFGGESTCFGYGLRGRQSIAWRPP